jgi:hypothetical protein
VNQRDLHPIHGDFTHRKRENHRNFTRNVGILYTTSGKNEDWELMVS